MKWQGLQTPDPNSDISRYLQIGRKDQSVTTSPSHQHVTGGLPSPVLLPSTAATAAWLPPPLAPWLPMPCVQKCPEVASTTGAESHLGDVCLAVAFQIVQYAAGPWSIEESRPQNLRPHFLHQAESTSRWRAVSAIWLTRKPPKMSASSSQADSPEKVTPSKRNDFKLCGKYSPVQGVCTSLLPLKPSATTDRHLRERNEFLNGRWQSGCPQSIGLLLQFSGPWGVGRPRA